MGMIIANVATQAVTKIAAAYGVRFTACAGAYFVGRLADQGLANTVGLATLRHGTNPFSWFSIHMFGADPSWGGNEIGGDHGMGYDQQNVGRFYMARENSFSSFMEEGFKVRFLSKMYTATGTHNLLNNCYIPTIIAFYPSLFTAIFLPTIKFRYDQDEANALLQDPSLQSACSTDQRVSPLKIGVIGTVYEACTLKTLSRINQNRIRVITGIAQLALAAVATYIFLLNCSAILLSYKVSIAASVALGML